MLAAVKPLITRSFSIPSSTRVAQIVEKLDSNEQNPERNPVLLTLGCERNTARLYYLEANCFRFRLRSIMKGVIVIVAYRPKPGKERELLELVRNRVPTLRKENLATDREPTIIRARDGTIVEVSEWKSQEAIDAAHKNANVLAMWDKFFAICDCLPLNTLDEAKEMFAGFEPIAD